MSGGPESKASPRRLRGAMLEEEATRLRLAGATYKEIGDQCGTSKQTAHKAVNRAMKRFQDQAFENVGLHVQEELERLNRLQLAIWRSAMVGQLGATDRVLKIMDHRARLKGLYTPERMEHTVRGGPVAKMSDDELREEAKRLHAEIGQMMESDDE